MLTNLIQEVLFADNALMSLWHQQTSIAPFFLTLQVQTQPAEPPLCTQMHIHIILELEGPSP